MYYVQNINLQVSRKEYILEFKGKVLGFFAEHENSFMQVESRSLGDNTYVITRPGGTVFPSIGHLAIYAVPTILIDNGSDNVESYQKILAMSKRLKYLSSIGVTSVIKGFRLLGDDPLEVITNFVDSNEDYYCVIRPIPEPTTIKSILAVVADSIRNNTIVKQSDLQARHEVSVLFGKQVAQAILLTQDTGGGVVGTRLSSVESDVININNFSLVLNPVTVVDGAPLKEAVECTRKFIKAGTTEIPYGTLGAGLKRYHFSRQEVTDLDVSQNIGLQYELETNSAFTKSGTTYITNIGQYDIGLKRYDRPTTGSIDVQFLSESVLNIEINEDTLQLPKLTFSTFKSPDLEEDEVDTVGDFVTITVALNRAITGVQKLVPEMVTLSGIQGDNASWTKTINGNTVTYVSKNKVAGEHKINLGWRYVD